MFKKTYATILNTFAKAIEDLEALAADNQSLALEKSEKVAVLTNEIKGLDDETARALKTSSKLRNLLDIHV